MNTLRRVAPAVGLFLFAPIVAEYLLGDLPVTMLFALVLMAPLYGGGALLIRELARRAGRGAPTMLLMGAAFGVIEEGLLTQSLFNPDYFHAHLLDDGFVPALGIAGPWTLYVLTLHTLWSTTVPILLVEATVPGRRAAPWLGRVGLAVVSVLFVLGCVATALQQRALFPYSASAAQLAACVVAAVVLVVLAFRIPRARAAAAGWVPPAWALGLGALVLASLFVAGHLGGSWYGVAGTLVVDAAVAALLLRWAARPAWTALHTTAPAAGAALAYAWQAFAKPTLIPTPPAVQLVGNILFAAVTVAVIVIGVARQAGRGPVRDQDQDRDRELQGS